MKLIIIFGSVIINGAVLFSFCSVKKQSVAASNEITSSNKGFAILELFTSQGCSSCPPADELLGKYVLKNDPNIIALAFHVDYWNRLGWKDSFSTAAYTDRQRKYAMHFQLDGGYTPQLVVNGQREMVGSNENEVSAAVHNCLSEQGLSKITIEKTELNGDSVIVNYTINDDNSNDIVETALVQKLVTTSIRAGENNGLKLKNYNVVRDFISVEKNAGQLTLHLAKGVTVADHTVIIFTQDKEDMKISGAAIRNIN